MKRFVNIFTRFCVVAFVAAIILPSCTNKALSLEEQQISLSQSENSYSKTIDEALSDMFVFWDAAYGSSTKGSDKKQPVVKNVCSVGVPQVKSNNSEIFGEHDYYVVSFENDKGFSILNAQKNGRPVIALTENGTIDATKLQNRLIEYSKEDYSRFTKDSISFHFIDTPDYYYSFLAELILDNARNSTSSLSTKSGDVPLIEVLSTRSPLVLSKWGQLYPFNQSMKYWLFMVNTDRLRKRSPVGCGIIAAAQIMKVVNHPLFTNLVNGYNWSSFNDLCNYTNYDFFLYDTFDNCATNDQKTRMQKLAKGLSIIADEFDATCYQDLTLVTLNNVKEGLKNMDSYYSNAAICYPTLDMSTLISMLDNGKPAFFSGSHHNTYTDEYYGHAWVADGYLHIRETQGESQMTYYCLHFNWGYYGSNDGYYTMESYYPTDVFSYDSIDIGSLDLSIFYNYHELRQFISY